MVGYGIDNAWPRCPTAPTETAEELRTLRGEVTRVITELRLSLFDLRSEVRPATAAWAPRSPTTPARSAPPAGLRVHLALDESTARLPAADRGRAAAHRPGGDHQRPQARRRANLWVTCRSTRRTRRSRSRRRQGSADDRPDGRYGLAIMGERAERIRGRLEITPRHPSGTTVAVVLGTSARRDSVRDSVTHQKGSNPSMTTSPAADDAHQGAARRRPRPDPPGPAARVRARPALRGRRRGRHGRRGGPPGRRAAARRRHHRPAAARRQRPRGDPRAAQGQRQRWASWC